MRILFLVVVVVVLGAISPSVDEGFESEFDKVYGKDFPTATQPRPKPPPPPPPQTKPLAQLAPEDRVQCVKTEWMCTEDGKLVPAPVSQYGLPVKFKKGVNVTLAHKNPRLQHRSMFLTANSLIEQHGWKYVIGIGEGESVGINLAEILADTTFIGILRDERVVGALKKRYPERKWLWAGYHFQVETTAVELAADVVLVVGNVLETEPEPEHLLDLLFGSKNERLSLAYRKLVIQFTPRAGDALSPAKGFIWQWKREELISYLKTAYNASIDMSREDGYLVFNGVPSKTAVVTEEYTLLGKPLQRPIV